MNHKSNYMPMKEITFEEYQKYVKEHDHIIIEDVELEIGKKWPIKSFRPEKFESEKTTVWSFPERGKWATHYLNAKYRGNWAPQVARNLILKYSEMGDTVLDAFLGSGTTLIECKLLGRNGIGVDINYEAVILSWDRLNFKCEPTNMDYLPSYFDNKSKDEDESTKSWHEPTIKLYQGDARNLDKIDDNSIDLIATHPPYADIISYSKKEKLKTTGDLSKVTSITEFVGEMKIVAKEFYRVLKPGRYCAILIGDTRRHRHYVPIAFRTMMAFLDVGFILKEDIIKLQHHMMGTIPWRRGKRDFYLISHEHLFVFRKLRDNESVKKYKESIKWW